MFSSPEEIMVVTNPDQEFIARDQAAMIGCGCRILSEPEGKNTLPAVYYGMREIEQSSGPAKVAVLPSDHMVHAGPIYADAFRKAEELAEKWLVLFGVKATGPHTGFGYIRPGPDSGRMPWILLRRNLTSLPPSVLRDGALEQRDVLLRPGSS